MTGLMSLVLFLLIVGIVLWLLPLDATIRKVVIGVMAIIALIWLFAVLGWVSVPALR